MKKIANRLSAGTLGCLIWGLAANGAHAGIDLTSWWTAVPDSSGGSVVPSNSGYTLTITADTSNTYQQDNQASFTAPGDLTGSATFNFTYTYALNASDSSSAAYFDINGYDYPLSPGTSAAGPAAFTLTAGLFVSFQLISEQNIDTLNHLPPAGLEIDLTAVPEPATGPWVAVFLALPIIGSLWFKLRRSNSPA